METTEFEMQYKKLDIQIRPLPPNYTPDSYAQQLLKDFPTKPAISYSASTNYDPNKDNN